MTLEAISDDELLASLPRGIRNKNPGNIEDGDFAKSLPGYKGGDGRFAIFDSMENGRAAQARLLASYGDRGISTVEGVVNRWAPRSENDTEAYTSVVAKRLGVDPRQPLDMKDERVVAAMADAMAEHENGVALDAPRGLDDVSDEELLASLKGEAARPTAAPAPMPTKPMPIPRKAGAKEPGVIDDAWSGFWAPGKELVDRVVDDYRKKEAELRKPYKAPSVGEFARGFVGDLGDSFGMVGDVLNLASAPANAIARPAARALAKASPLPAYEGPKLSFDGGIPRLSAPRKLSQDEARQAIESDLITALGAAAPTKRVSIPTKAKIPSLDELRAANDAAWSRVDASGYRFPKSDLTSTATDVRKLINEAGPELYPEATKIAARVEALAKRGELTPAQANRLRSQIGEKLMQPGSTEASVGAAIKSRIDQLIDTANDPNLAEARKLHTQVKKLEAVTGAEESADLRTAASGSGGNADNAIRQRIRPMIDPTSKQRIRNFTPDEAAAAKRVVKGTPAQNFARTLGKASPTGGLMQALHLGGATLSKGLTIPLSVATIMAKAKGDAAALENLQRLQKIIAAGGSKEALKGIPLSELAYPTIGALEALQLPELALDNVPLLQPRKAPAKPASPEKPRGR